jgi:hypothetical protein
VIIGIIGAIFGGRGLANAVQNTLNTVWHVPKVDRPGFPSNYLRTFGLLGLLGLGAVATALVASVAGAGDSLGLSGVPVKALTFAITTVLYIGLFLAAFRLGTAKVVATRDLVLGAVLSGIAWQILLSLAGLIVGHDLKHAQAVAGFFGVVLGMLAWFGLQATVTVYAGRGGRRPRPAIVAAQHHPTAAHRCRQVFPDPYRRGGGPTPRAARRRAVQRRRRTRPGAAARAVRSAGLTPPERTAGH